MVKWSWVLDLRSSIFYYLPEGPRMDEQSWALQVCCRGGSAEAAAFLLVPLSGWRLWCLFVPLHIGNSVLYFRIWTAIPCGVLLGQSLLRSSDGCTEVAGSPVELLWQGNGWQLPAVDLMPVAYGNLAVLGWAFSLCVMPLQTHKWSPVVSRWHRAYIILMWLSVNNGGGLRRIASCCGEHCSVAPWRSASSVVVPCSGVFCGDTVGVPNCMGNPWVSGRPLPNPGGSFSCCCSVVHPHDHHDHSSGWDGSVLKCQKLWSLMRYRHWWLVTNLVVSQIILQFEVLVVQFFPILIFIEEGGCMLLLCGLAVVVFLDGYLLPGQHCGCGGAGQCSSCGGALSIVWISRGLSVHWCWWREICNRRVSVVLLPLILLVVSSLRLSPIVTGQGLQYRVGYPWSILWCGFGLRMDAFTAVEWTFVSRLLIFVQAWEGHLVQWATVVSEVFPFLAGFNQIAVFEPILQQLQSGDNMSLGFVVRHVICGLGAVLVIMPPWHVVHDFMKQDEDGVWVPHGVDLVVQKEHQLALLSHVHTVGLDRVGVIPTFGRRISYVHSLLNLTQTSIWYSLLWVGDPGGSASVGLGGDVMSSEGMNGIRKWTPLFVSTRVVMVDAIMQWAKMVTWDGRVARYLILASYALQCRVPITYLTNSKGSVSRALYGESL